MSFSKSAQFYDAIYSWKDYASEAAKLHALIEQYKRSPGISLLDVACGTGAHIPFLREHYAIEGLDLSEEMLVVARQRYPGITFHQGDMTDFELGRRFDVVLCLFSSIGYAQSVAQLEQALAVMSRHTLPGGVVIVEPWLTPEQWQPGTTHALFVDQPDLKLARMNVSGLEGRFAIMDMHHLVATAAGVEHFVEQHRMLLFTQEEYLAAFRAAGLEVTYDAEGLMGRGLYLGKQPLA